MKYKNAPKGAFIVWPWSDPEIENPRKLKEQLVNLVDAGFSGVLVSLRNTRYEFTDRTVLRTLAQVSQWAKIRNMDFWFQVDPRQASRSFIEKTGERMQNLIAVKKPGKGLIPSNINLCKVENNQFQLHYDYPRIKQAPMMQEKALCFEPECLERAFLFQMDNGKIIRDTVRDITAICHFYSNVEDGFIEVFGNLRIPSDEEWWITAFPKLSTNLYDYAGRESNDQMLGFIEDLFDACTHLDGVTWGDRGAGYVVNLGRFPVSLSLYNSFKAEHGYDLQDVLFGLIFECDDGSHIKTRCDYYSLLMEMVFGAKKDFYHMVNSFFSGLDGGIHNTFPNKSCWTDKLIQGTADPWKSLEMTNSSFTETEVNTGLSGNPESLISMLGISKSLGVFSKTKTAYFQFNNSLQKKETLIHVIDLMALFSVRWLAHIQNRISDLKELHYINPENFTTLNKRIKEIEKITEFTFPISDTALIYPVSTIMSINSAKAEKIIETVNMLIAQFIKYGYQCDIISPLLFKEGRLTPQGLQIRDRTYESIIYPYPQILDPEVLEIVSLLNTFQFPVLLGGCKPEYTTLGKKIPHTFTLDFNPEKCDFEILKNEGIDPLIKKPANCLVSAIQIKRDSFLLICPFKAGDSVQGEVRYLNTSIALSGTSELEIYQIHGESKVEHVF